MIRTLLLFVLLMMLSACKPAPSSGPDLAQLLRGADSAGFAPITPSLKLAFPADHGAHFAQRLEWWYFVGNLRASDGREFGYQLTIFRLGLQPRAPSEIALAGEQVLMGHFALSDLSGGRYWPFERFARVDGRLGMVQNPPLVLKLDHWSITQQAGTPLAFNLQASQDGIAIDLNLRADSAIVLQGEQGYSQKSADPANASAYYSVPRLLTTGQIRIDGAELPVEGLSWLDREWSSSQLARDQVGWRWYALHLDDGSNLMLYTLINADGTTDAWSKGTWLPADGPRQNLTRDDFEIRTLREWQAPNGSRYAVDSQVEIPALGLSLKITAALDNQLFSGMFTYWEGAVRVSGSHTGRGYLEMTDD